VDLLLLITSISFIDFHPVFLTTIKVPLEMLKELFQEGLFHFLSIFLLHYLRFY